MDVFVYSTQIMIVKRCFICIKTYLRFPTLSQNDNISHRM